MDIKQRALIANSAYIEDHNLALEELSLIMDVQALRFIYVPKTDTEAYIIKYNDHDCIIALAGTGSLKDFKYDLFFWPKKYKVGYVHKGFYEIIIGLKDEINKNLKDMFPSTINHLDIIGHSLGAAEACLLIDEIRIPYVSHLVICFGCPNGFSNKARKYLNKYNIHQYINNGDYVTMMLGITSGKPYTDKVYLQGPLGHMMSKYIQGVEKI